MDKHYVGYSFLERRVDVFAADRPEEATSVASGYDAVSGPYESKEEAEAARDEYLETVTT